MRFNNQKDGPKGKVVFSATERTRTCLGRKNPHGTFTGGKKKGGNIRLSSETGGGIFAPHKGLLTYLIPPEGKAFERGGGKKVGKAREEEGKGLESADIPKNHLDIDKGQGRKRLVSQ